MDAPGAPAAAEGTVEDDALAWLLMEDDDVSQMELVNLLDDGKDKDLDDAAGRVRFIDDPYSSLLVCQSSSSYITINGNEESCGSSFSDSSTSVMASVDTNGSSVGRGGGAWASSDEAAREVDREGWVFGEGLLLDGCDEFDCEWDDEVLGRLLGQEEDVLCFKAENVYQ